MTPRAHQSPSAPPWRSASHGDGPPGASGMVEANGIDLQIRALADGCAVLDVNWRTSTGQRQLDSVSAAEREMSSPLDSDSTGTCGSLGANCNPSTGQRQLDGVKLSCCSTPANPATFPRRSRTVLDVFDLWTWLPDPSCQMELPRCSSDNGAQLSAIARGACDT